MSSIFRSMGHLFSRDTDDTHYLRGSFYEISAPDEFLIYKIH